MFTSGLHLFEACESLFVWFCGYYKVFTVGFHPFELEVCESFVLQCGLLYDFLVIFRGF